MTQITTHVLDTARGRPAAGVPSCSSAATTTAGRGSPPPPPTPTAARDLGDVAPGQHRLTFDTGALSSFYPRVVIHFTVAAGENHYHVPLLLSPYGYTTYRGS